jgi:hypothetical protein
MLTGADLPETYWHDTLQYAALLHNVSPTRTLRDMTLKKHGAATSLMSCTSVSSDAEPLFTFLLPNTPSLRQRA